MSAGSNNIVVQVTDQVDATIAPKIREISNAASQANININSLNIGLNNLGGGTARLRTAVAALTPNLQQATASTGRLEGAVAQLMGRVVGAEAGFGMLGGAFARVGVAAGIAGPLIIAALAIGAIAGAILLYEKFEAAARKLVEAQITLNEHLHRQHDTLLDLNEELIGLTQGPMAKYAAQLRDLPFKTIAIDSAALIKVLEDQKSKWASLVGWVERYIAASGKLEGEATQEIKQPFGIQQAQDFIRQHDESQAGSKNQLQGLQNVLKETGAKLIELHNLEADLTDRDLQNTEVSRKALQVYYQEKFNDLQEYNAKVKRERLGAAGELLSEQRKASEEELKQFNDMLYKMKSGSEEVSPQRILALRTQQLTQFTKEHPGAELSNSPFNNTYETLEKARGSATQAILKEDHAISDLVQKFKNEALAVGVLSAAERAEVEYRKALVEVDKAGPENKNGPAALASIRESIFATQQAKSLEPLREYVIKLSEEIDLFGKYGVALTAATEVNKLADESRRKGHELTLQETEALTKYVAALNQQKAIEQEVNTLHNQNAGALDKLNVQQLGLNQALQKGVISLEQYKVASLDAALAQNKLFNETGLGSFQSHVLQVLGSLTAGFTSFTNGATKSFETFFQSLDKGFANSVSRFLVFNESISKGLLDMARNAVATLISSLIELGIQYILVTELEKVFGINIPKAQDTSAATLKNMAVSLLAIATVTAAELEAINVLQVPAWSLAEAMSLISFGANAVGATAGIAAVMAAGQAAQHFSGGGPVIGPGGDDKVLGRLTAGEYVVNAQATSQNRELLDSINRGSSAVRSNGASVGGSHIQVIVQHDGSTAIRVEQMSDSRIRVIAQQEAKVAVQTHSANVIAQDLQNPNSRTSKALAQNVEVKRRR